MTAYITHTKDYETESLLGDTYAPTPETRPYVSVRTKGGTVHAWTVTGFKCGRTPAYWDIDQRGPAVTCRQCLRVLEAESNV